MRIQIGEPPASTESPLHEQGWRRVEGPKSSSAYLGAALIGIALTSMLLALIIAASILSPAENSNGPEADQATPWAVIILTLPLSIAAHELIHIALHPDHGLSPASILVIWPRRLRFGAYYEGFMTRSRWLTMRLAPLAILTFLPAAIMMAAPTPRSIAVETSLALLLLVNALGSGGDILAAIWVLLHLPPQATLRFHQGKAYWTQVEPETRISL